MLKPKQNQRVVSSGITLVDEGEGRVESLQLFFWKPTV
jgi:hypothetical protein